MNISAMKQLLPLFAVFLPLLEAAHAAPQVGTVPYRASATGAGNSYSSVFSADGRHIAFVSHANNLVTNDDLAPHLDLFVRDLVTSNTVLVSVSTNGFGGANDNIGLYSLSSNAQVVAFDTAASNLSVRDNNRVSDIYVHDLQYGGRWRVSVGVNPDGDGNANGPSYNPQISEDGRYVIFESLASNLVTNDFNGTNDIFICDLTTGITTLVSVNTDGTASPDGPSYSPSTSANGLIVAFASRATNLVIGVTNLLDEIYVRDVAGASNLWAQAAHLSGTHSRSPASGALEPYRASEPVLSADGRYVAFKTLGQTIRFDLLRPTNSVILLFTNNSIFPPHLATHRFDDNPRLAASSGETPMAFGTDGRYLAYTTKSNLLPNAGIILVDFESLATNWVFIPPPGGTSGGYPYYATNVTPVAQIVLTNSVSGAFATWTQLPWLGLNSNASRLFFLADGTNLVFSPTNRPVQLYGLDLPNGPTRLISVNRSGLPGSGLSGVVPATTPDGSLLTWDSPDDNIVADDLNRAWDVFVRNVDTGETQLVSARHPDLPAVSGLALSRLDLNPAAISADGRRIAFVSLDNTLTLGDTNLVRDIFVHDLSSGSMFNVSGFPLSQMPFNPVNLGAGPSISADGRYLAFAGDKSTPSSTNRTIYWRDLQASTNRVIASGNSLSQPVVSPDGQLVAFHSSDLNEMNFPDNNNQPDVFVYKVPLTEFASDFPQVPVNRGNPMAVSTTPSNSGTGNAGSVNPAFSPDGSWLLFQSLATNLTEEAPEVQQKVQLFARGIEITNSLFSAAPFQRSVLFLSPTRLISYITSASPEPDGKSVEQPIAGGAANPRFSADSSYLAFESTTNLIYRHDLLGGFVTTVTEQGGVFHTNTARLTNDLVCSSCGNPTLNADGRFVAYETRRATNVANDVFVKDLQTGQEELVSLNLAGSGGGNASSSTPLISHDARFVVFASKASDLVENDTNRANDIFVRDRSAGVTHCVSRNWLGTGTGNRVSSNPVLAANGRTVAFQSFASDLVHGDFNDTRDVFVLTLGGPDTDGDHMDDDWEMTYFSTLSRDGTGDFDSDGISDRDEFRAGTNPGNEGSVLRVLSISLVSHSTGLLQKVLLMWTAVPGKKYRVQYKEIFLDATWSDLGQDIIASTTTASQTDLVNYQFLPDYVRNTFRRFYRVVIVE